MEDITLAISASERQTIKNALANQVVQIEALRGDLELFSQKYLTAVATVDQQQKEIDELKAQVADLSDRLNAAKNRSSVLVTKIIVKPITNGFTVPLDAPARVSLEFFSGNQVQFRLGCDEKGGEFEAAELFEPFEFDDVRGKIWALDRKNGDDYYALTNSSQRKKCGDPLIVHINLSGPFAMFSLHVE